MFGSYSPAAASLSTVSHAANTPASPPTRPSRLRGLSYLRNYTHNHLHSPTSTSTATSSQQPTSPSQPPPLNRSTSSPARSRHPESRPRDQSTPTPAPAPAPSQAPAATGWVPTVGGQSGLSAVATQHESVTADPVPPAMTRARAQTASEDRPTSPRSTPTNVVPTPAPTTTTTTTTTTTSSTSPPQPAAEKKQDSPTIRLIPHHEPRSTRPSLTFPIVTRTISATGQRVKVGRYSERDQPNDAQNSSKTSNPVGFKSKVVSRRHCELWCDNGQWFVKDCKSSSGTFLNHVRLSSPGTESRAYPVNDGDIIQLGIDFKGGEEVIFRCVKIRVECNRGWQKSLNQFNTSTHKQLLKQARATPNKDSDAQSTHSSECSICLNPVAPCQALFVAPCSHVWHYKCIRSLIYPAWPSFQCPNCRAYADLEADVEPSEDDEDESTDEALDDALKKSEADAECQEKTCQDSLPPVESGELEDADLTAMMNSVSVQSTSATESSSDGEAGPSQASTSRPMPILASTNAPVNRTLPDSIMARSATPTSSTPFAFAATSGVLPDGQATPMNDAGPFFVDQSRRAQNIDEIAREPVHEEAEE